MSMGDGGLARMTPRLPPPPVGALNDALPARDTVREGKLEAPTKDDWQSIVPPGGASLAARTLDHELAKTKDPVEREKLIRNFRAARENTTLEKQDWLQGRKPSTGGSSDDWTRYLEGRPRSHKG